MTATGLATPGFSGFCAGCSCAELWINTADESRSVADRSLFRCIRQFPQRIAVSVQELASYWTIEPGKRWEIIIKRSQSPARPPEARLDATRQSPQQRSLRLSIPPVAAGCRQSCCDIRPG